MESNIEPEKNTTMVKAKNLMKSLRTYQGDVEEAMSKNKFSASSIVVAEQRRRDSLLEEPQAKVRTQIKNKSFFIIGIILFLIGISAIILIYYYVTSNDKIILEQETKTLVSFTKEQSILMVEKNKEQLIATILKEKQLFKSTPNSVLYLNTINTINKPENVKNILTILTPRMPDSLLRAIEEKYMLGIYSFDTNEPFIILTTNDFATSYSSMLKWEENMTSDLGGLFNIIQNASTTNSIFIDEALKNKDLRVLKNTDGKTILLYSFIDKNTMVITTNEGIFQGLLGKYMVSKLVH